MATEIEHRLLVISTINYRLEKLVQFTGIKSLTIERIVELVAEVIMPDMAGGVRICPGWGKDQNHVWAWTDSRPRKESSGLLERCDNHPERRCS